MTDKDRQYLGDGVYIELIHGTVKLSVGGSSGSVIYLEPQVLAGLIRYVGLEVHITPKHE